MQKVALSPNIHDAIKQMGLRGRKRQTRVSRLAHGFGFAFFKQRHALHGGIPIAAKALGTIIVGHT